MWLLIPFIVIPIIEIGLFIQVGGFLGLWPTLLIVVLTAIIGANLVKSQGLSVLSDVQRSMSQFTDPMTPLAHGAMVLFSGALLLTPGFFTDIIGFLLLVPQIRTLVIGYAKTKISLKTAQTTRHQDHGDTAIIDAEYTEIHDPLNPSPWKKDKNHKD